VQQHSTLSWTCERNRSVKWFSQALNLFHLDVDRRRLCCKRPRHELLLCVAALWLCSNWELFSFGAKGSRSLSLPGRHKTTWDTGIAFIIQFLMQSVGIVCSRRFESWEVKRSAWSAGWVWREILRCSFESKVFVERFKRFRRVTSWCFQLWLRRSPIKASLELQQSFSGTWKLCQPF
jgi:hypothetical protein